MQKTIRRFKESRTLVMPASLPKILLQDQAKCVEKSPTSPTARSSPFGKQITTGSAIKAAMATISRWPSCL